MCHINIYMVSHPCKPLKAVKDAVKKEKSWSTNQTHQTRNTSYFRCWSLIIRNFEIFWVPPWPHIFQYSLWRSSISHCQSVSSRIFNGVNQPTGRDNWVATRIATTGGLEPRAVRAPVGEAPQGRKGKVMKSTEERIEEKKAAVKTYGGQKVHANHAITQK